MEVVFASPQNALVQKRKRRASPEKPVAGSLRGDGSSFLLPAETILVVHASLRAAAAGRKSTVWNTAQNGQRRWLSAGRHALEGAPLAPGMIRRAQLSQTRHVVLRVCAPLPYDLLSRQPEVPFQLSHEALLNNLQSSKR